jgi:hypothetical protein
VIPGEPDEVAAIEAWYRARVAEIQAQYQELLGEWQSWDAGAAGAEAARTGAFFFPVDPKRAAEERDKKIEECERTYLRKVEVLEARQRLAVEDVDTSSQRDPLPIRKVERVVRLRLVDRLSWPEIEEGEKAKGGLSHRKINYVREAIEFDDLGWDFGGNCLTLGPETRNTPAGFVLPRR